MAVTLRAAVAASLTVMLSKRVRQIEARRTLIHLLPHLRGAGEGINWGATFSGRTDAVAALEGAALGSADADTELKERAILPWTNYFKVSSVSGLLEAIVGSNVGPESYTGDFGNSAIVREVVDACERLYKGVARDLYIGDGTASPTQVTGLNQALTTTGLYAGLDRTTYPEWASVVNTIPLASLSFDQIRTQLFTPIYDASDSEPEFVVCGTATFDAVRALFREQERRMMPVIELARGGGESGLDPRVIKLKTGSNMFEVDGVAFARDKACPENRLYALNTAHTHIEYLDAYAPQRAADRATEIERILGEAMGDPEYGLPQADLEGLGSMFNRLMPQFDLLGKRGDSREVNAKMYIQLVCERPNENGILILTP